MFELLSDERRRYVLYYLKEQNRAVPVDELAETVAAWDDSVTTDQAVKSVEIELQHEHIPKATEVEYIEYNPDEGLVELQGHPRRST